MFDEVRELRIQRCNVSRIVYAQILQERAKEARGEEVRV